MRRELVASFFTLSGGGFGEPPRNTFIERCEAAAAAGFTGIGLHADDLPRTPQRRASTSVRCRPCCGSTA